jgi:hypothetical protein
VGQIKSQAIAAGNQKIILPTAVSLLGAVAARLTLLQAVARRSRFYHPLFESQGLIPDSAVQLTSPACADQ